MRRPSRRFEPQAQDAARRQTKPAVGRFAVDEIAGTARSEIRGFRSVAAAFFANHEQQPDARLAAAAELFGGRDLRRQNPLGIAGAASVNAAPLDAAGK